MRLIIIVLMLLSFEINAASFDCSFKSLSKIESKICSSETLSKKDEILSVLYRVVSDDIENGTNYGFKKDNDFLNTQKKWLNKRNSCKNKICIESLYDHRIDELLMQAATIVDIRTGGILKQHLSKASGKQAKDIYDIEVLWFRRYRGNNVSALDGKDIYHDQVRAIVKFFTDDPDKPGSSWCGASNLTHIVFLAADEYNVLTESAHLQNNDCMSHPNLYSGFVLSDEGPIVGFGDSGEEGFKAVYLIRDFGGSKWLKVLDDKYNENFHRIYNDPNSFLQTVKRNGWKLP